jgi:peptidoglycan/xylan/chitin deacetylase (PgdA/CDA1 family)
VTERTRRAPLVLGYHAVSTTWEAQLAVSEPLLRSQLAYLRRRGYVGLTLADAERRRREGSLPKRSLVVTFDDGYASTLRALPILAELELPGTVFLVTDFVDSGEPLSWPGVEHWAGPGTIDELRPLTWEQAERLVEEGWEVGSHTASHALLPRVDDERLRAELTTSRSAIERRLGACRSVAYPYGLADERVAREAGDAGYEVGCTLTFVHDVDEPLRRPRVGIGPSDDGLRLRTQTSPLGRAFRRSPVARAARRLRRRRPWLPED